jgi:hypothetical protein
MAFVRKTTETATSTRQQEMAAMFLVILFNTMVGKHIPTG